MRWAELFRDLEGQIEAAQDAALAGEVADRTRREFARIRVVDRLRPAADRQVAVAVHGAGTVRGSILDSGPDWLLVGEGRGLEALIPLSAVLGLVGLDPRTAAEPFTEGEVAARFGLGHALRALARDRAQVECIVLDGSASLGTIERVGADHLEVAEHAVGERPRRTGEQSFRLVPFGALALVRRR